MTVSDKVAYLKGLADGLGLDKDTKEGKLFAAIIDTLDVIACEVGAIEESAEMLNDEVDALSEDLEDVESYVFDDEDEDEDDEYSPCAGCHGCGSDEEEEEDEADEDEEFIYEVKCPACDCEFTVDEDALALGQVKCPECGENLEFDFDEDAELIENGEEE